MTPPSEFSEPRRSFVKKTLATSVSISFAGLIRAHGEGGGTGATTVNTTIGTEPVTTEVTLGTEQTTTEATFTVGTEYTDFTVITTIGEEETTTCEATEATTTAPHAVEGKAPVDSGVFQYSSYWWYKAKIVVSSPNPGGEVTVSVCGAGAEMGSGSGAPPPEQTGSVVSVAGKVDSAGNFSSSSVPQAANLPSVGYTDRVAIGSVPGWPVPQSWVWACIRVDSITETDNKITMKGKVWAETGTTTGTPSNPSTKKDWEVSVEKIQ